MTATDDPIVANPLTITDAAAALRAGTTTSVELVQACLDRADAVDEQLGVFLARFDDDALTAAAAADAELAAGQDRGPLHGIPIGVKDIIASKEGPTTAQSLVLDPAWAGSEDAVVVERLREAGAIVVGKAATLEFAIGIADPDKPFPIHRNPWDPDRWPGGSSAGTGSGVAAGCFLGGLGTDTGGSVRIPAAFCGITGLKATHGRVPKSGCVPLGYSLDHIGPMARSASDREAMLAVMAGHHPSDPTSALSPQAGASEGGMLPPPSLDGVRLGVDWANHLDGPNVRAEAVTVLEAAVDTLGELGAEVVEVEIPHYAEGNVADILIMVCEAASYHARDLQDRWSDYGSPTRKILTWAAAYSSADYVQAQRLRRLVARETNELLDTVD
ncbi:MAG: amidase, partial [Actinomycetota bacterium]